MPFPLSVHDINISSNKPLTPAIHLSVPPEHLPETS